MFTDSTEIERQRRLNRSSFSDSLPAESTSEGGIDAMTGWRREVGA